MRDLAVPVVALSVRYHEGPDSTSESAQDIVVIPRSDVDGFSHCKSLKAADGEPRLSVGWDDASVVSRCDWDQLVLDPTIVSLLKDDFESFFEREVVVSPDAVAFSAGISFCMGLRAMGRVPQSER